MGHTQSTIVVVDVGSFDSPTGPVKVSHAYDGNLGALNFDLKLFDHFSSICQKQYGEAISPGSKRGQRLILGCERIRKLLSQLPESSITVENMSDSGDVNFTLKRDDLLKLCADELKRFKELIKSALVTAGVVIGGGEGSEENQLGAVEVLGGGVRMQVVQMAIQSVVGEVS